MKLLRLSSLSAVALGALALAPAAQAGSFNVPTCGAASGAVNHSWANFNTNPTYVETGDLCNNGSPGLYTDDALTSPGNVPQGTEAGWIVNAPAGTTITAATVNRDFFKHDNNFLLFVRDASGMLLDPGCTYPVSQTSCQVSGSESWNALSTSSISVGVHCNNNPNTVCATGGTLHNVHAWLLSATVTLTESTSPNVSSTGGPLLAGGWQSGTQNGTLSATDNTGIQYVRVYVDNALANTVGLNCDFTYTVPCSAASNVNVPLNTASYSDGAHQVQLAAVNAAGNQTPSGAVGVNFDNTAPTAPVGISAANATSGPINVSWTNPSQGAGSPIAKVHWQACKSGTGCSAPQTSSSSLTSLTFDPTTTAPFSGGPNGSYTISVWLEDAAGNTNQTNAGVVSVAYGPSQISPGSTGNQISSSPAPVLTSPGGSATTGTKKQLAKRRRHCVVAHRRRSLRHKASNKRSSRHRARCVATRRRIHPKR